MVIAASWIIPRVRRLERPLGYAWTRGMRRILGMRVRLEGSLPPHPYFIVMNHMTWLDYFGMISYVDARPVAEDPLRTLPLVGILFRSINPIFVRRVRQDTSRVMHQMTEALRRGESLVLAPETPETTGPLGKSVRMFRAGLLQSAIDAGRAVHYMSLTYTTPADCPPPSEVLMFGPNPLYRPEGEIPKAELEAFGGRHSFLGHALGVLALPSHELTIRFGQHPIQATDRITLANSLHEAVERIFQPIE